MKESNTVEESNTIKVPMECAEKHIKYLLDNSFLTKVCCIDDRSTMKSVNEQIDKYFENNTDKIYKEGNSTNQVGRLWILLFNDMESLNVGQSLYIQKEIMSDVEDMLNKEVGLYHQIRQECKGKGKLTFYEVDIDKYMTIMFGVSNLLTGVKRAMYDMCKEYVAEATIAYRTASKYWRYLNCGMDKRAYFYIHNL